MAGKKKENKRRIDKLMVERAKKKGSKKGLGGAINAIQRRKKMLENL